jgi:hypothetical protein
MNWQWICSVILLLSLVLLYLIFEKIGSHLDEEQPSTAHLYNVSPGKLRFITGFNDNVKPSHNNSCQLSSSLHQVLLIRSCGNISSTAKQLFIKHALDVSKLEQYDVWLVYDAGNDSSDNSLKHILQLQNLQAEQPNIGVFIYNSKSILSFLANAEFLRRKPQVNRWFHDASIMAWASYCRPDLWQAAPHPFQSDHFDKDLFLWSVEADTVYIGNVSNFFNFYDDDSSDYIGRYTHPNPAWLHFNITSWSTPVNHKWMKLEHVERFSFTLVWFLFSLAEMNVVAHGELFSSTVCSLVKEWCTMSVLDSRFLGENYSWNSRISDAQVAALQQNTTQQNKWHHAVQSCKSVGCT